MKAAMGVRLARPEDCAEIARLGNELGYRSTSEEIAARLSVLDKSDRHRVLVAAGERSAILGWIAAEERLVLESGERTEIVGLVVDSKFRQRGVGRALIDEVERWAQSRGRDRVVVRSNAARSESHPFFQAAGYARSKTQHVYVKDLGAGGHAGPTG